MDRRQPQDIRVPLYNNGSARAPRASCTTAITVPKDAKGPVTLSAGTHYRKFSRDYTTFSLGAAHPSLPVTTLASDAVTLAVGRPAASGLPTSAPRGNPDPLWLRWNDYGIGLFLQGDLKGAAAAWTRVTELAPDKPDGPLNRARAEIAEGRLRRREGVARRGRDDGGRAGARRRSSAPIVCQGRGTPGGRRNGSPRRARQVPARPRRLEQPRPRLLAGRKVPRSDRRLREDPRDRSGGLERALQPDARLPRHRRPEERRDPRRGLPQVQGGRVDPRGPRASSASTTRSPTGNRCRFTSTPRPCRLRRPPPDWVASIGPKGYETDHGYLTRAHPPVPSEQDQWSYVSAHRSGQPVAPSAPRVSSAP